MRREVQVLAKRCGNLNGEQLGRLLAYKVAVEKALDAICLFYHCKKYHSSYSPIRVVFDRTRRANNREELVFKETKFVWITKNVMTSIKQIHSELASVCESLRHAGRWQASIRHIENGPRQL
jgi:riboflavin biosynthesis pyrimidine reductase